MCLGEDTQVVWDDLRKHHKLIDYDHRIVAFLPDAHTLRQLQLLITSEGGFKEFGFEIPKVEHVIMAGSWAGWFNSDESRRNMPNLKKNQLDLQNFTKGLNSICNSICNTFINLLCFT